MRIISGTARGRRLQEFPGGEIRPTPDRVREALFSMLVSRLGPLQGKKVLDLFSGTGALGIEALSRGAVHAWLVDRNRRSCELIRNNLERCQLAPHADVVQLEIPARLGELRSSSPFDLILLDPPYRQGLAETTLRQLAELQLLADGGYVCVETERDEPLPERCGDLALESTKSYGRTAMHLYTRLQDEHP